MNILTPCIYKTIKSDLFQDFIYNKAVKTCLSVSASPVDFAGLVPASILSIWSVVSMLALEVNKGEEDKKQVRGE